MVERRIAVLRFLPGLLCVAALLVSVASVTAAGFRLAPYKDDLFAYPPVIASAYDGDYIRVAFDQKRDVIDRDDKPDERTRAEYVSLDVKETEVDLVFEGDGVKVPYVGVGRTGGKAKIILIFIHGWQATRHDGVNDWRSGGNLNRIKNLMVRNGGVYLSPDFSGNRRQAAREIRALMFDALAKSPGAPVFIVCASLGARVCFDLARDKDTASRIDGMIFLAGVSESGFAKTPAAKLKVPIYLTHGNRDSRVPWRGQETLFKSVKAASPDYPIRFVVFDTGTHRAPLRMTDWRLALNWMLEVRGR